MAGGDISIEEASETVQRVDKELADYRDSKGKLEEELDTLRTSTTRLSHSGSWIMTSGQSCISSISGSASAGSRRSITPNLKKWSTNH